MSPGLIALVLFAAILHASWNALVKSGGSPLYSIAAYILVSGIVSLCLVWWVPLPSAGTWPFLAASVLLHTVYFFTLAQAYRSGDLSLVYPLFRGMAPMLVAGGAAWFAGEFLSPGALGGVLLISAGLMALALFGGRHLRGSLPALGWGAVTAVLIAAYTIADGVGVRTVENNLSYILWLFVCQGLPVCLWLVATQRRAWFGYVIQNRCGVLAGGLASAAAYGLVIHAMSIGAMALVSSLRETSVIFAALIGTLLLKEPFGRRRIAAACLVALGVIVIRYHA